MNTRNIFMIAAIAASLAALNADAATVDSPPSTPKLDIPKVANMLKQQREELPSPGIYLSKPYLSIVIVPEPVDPAFEHILGDIQTDDCVIRPHTHLEPYRPAK